jgi:hypothetical protein
MLFESEKRKLFLNFMEHLRSDSHNDKDSDFIEIDSHFLFIDSYFMRIYQEHIKKQNEISLIS